MEKRLISRLKIPDDRSIIVVSDLHLGGAEDPDTSERFCTFLAFLREGFQEHSVYCEHCSGEKGAGNGGQRTLLPPEKIILLGDILELWDSRQQDRNIAFLDAVPPINELKQSDCDVVYVTGNHDEDMTEMIASYAKDRKKNATHPDERATSKHPATPEKYRVISSKKDNKHEKAESLTFAWGGGRSIELCSRHYPAPKLRGGELGIKVGGVSYAFIHGQQFDRVQIPYTISEAMGQRFDPVDYLQDIANVSFSKQVGMAGLALITVLFGSFAALYYFPQVRSLIPIPLVGGAIGLFLTGVFLSGALFFGRKKKSLPSSVLMAAICLLIALIFLGAVIAGWLRPLFWFGFLVSAYAFVVITLPRMCAVSKRKVYNAFTSSRNKKAKELIDSNLFDASKYKYTSKVLVFGHTHIPDFTKDTKTEKVKLLVNTGSWVKDTHREYDSFVYIDTNGICCMRWVNDANEGKGAIECLCREKDGSPNVSLCDYIAKNHLNLNE